jgi:hypothetical protein
VQALWSHIWNLLGGSRALAIGLIGAKLSTVQTNDGLFTFFNFAPIGEEKQSAGRTVTSFKPTGEAFRALVTLKVTTDSQGAIRQLSLTVARSFIDDSSKCIYAADLVKSFLYKAGAATNDDAVGALAREISARSMSRSSVTMITAQALPQPPPTISPAYKTYAGDEHPQSLAYPLGNLQVTLRNEMQDNVPVLVLTVEPAGAARAAK